MTTYQVECINKPDRTSRNERIQRLGGTYPYPWRRTEDEVISGIRYGGDVYYTLVDGNVALVIVAERNGRPYLKTQADSTFRDNLLALPECR